MANVLTNENIKRYGRQLILPEFGMQSQIKLKSSSALIVGCGGLGCPSAIYLAAAGIGRLGLLDNDVVELSNLHRQVLHQTETIGLSKSTSLKNACNKLNPDTEYTLHLTLINSANAVDIIKQYDLVIDCTDNVPTRYLLNDVCVLEKKPLVSGAAIKFEGQLTIYNYLGGPCYRCIYPVPPPAEAVSNCSQSGVLGAVPGIIGTMQAQEAIKILTGIGETLSSRLFIYDGLSFTTRVIKLRPRQLTCDVCGENPRIKSPVDYEQFCGMSATDNFNSAGESATGSTRITAEQYNTVYKNNKHILIDTRPPVQLEICQLPNATNLPLPKLLKLGAEDLQKLIAEKQTDSLVCVCQHGNDSQLAVQHLMKLKTDQSELNVSVVDIIGGLDLWARKVDASFPRY